MTDIEPDQVWMHRVTGGAVKVMEVVSTPNIAGISVFDALGSRLRVVMDPYVVTVSVDDDTLKPTGTVTNIDKGSFAQHFALVVKEPTSAPGIGIGVEQSGLVVITDEHGRAFKATPITLLGAALVGFQACATNGIPLTTDGVADMLATIKGLVP